LDEAERAWQLLVGKLADSDKMFNEVEAKLSKYVQKIKEGARINHGEEEILEELRKLKGESDDIDKSMRKVDTKKNTISGKER
jgi:hypothetical protein